ncbi:hypothetical protein [Limnochorda pilosa]|uniref:Uncharacterized protein n=1 Tax=Limnochorda pilosa TaxID=1555112 RepID=A0A0K2SQI8_LIMPI|nr:hypothetical protein [Limnochorda pilosa]BAS29366.1 hypothetical protein LIP_3555 [Limnochorda pilosa]
MDGFEIDEGLRSLKALSLRLEEQFREAEEELARLRAEGGPGARRLEAKIFRQECECAQHRRACRRIRDAIRLFSGASEFFGRDTTVAKMGLAPDLRPWTPEDAPEDLGGRRFGSPV